jgi:hypothetical protein
VERVKGIDIASQIIVFKNIIYSCSTEYRFCYRKYRRMSIDEIGGNQLELHREMIESWQRYIVGSCPYRQIKWMQLDDVRV